MSVPTLIITGTVGVGKSAVTAEINDVLALLEIPSAAVDVDALVWQWPSSSPWNSDLAFENLAALWPNYHAHGAARLILARVVEERRELERYRTAIPGAMITVCRLTAPEGLRRRRLQTRMPPGESRDWHLHRSVELEELLDAGRVEDFAVDNGDRPIREVAVEALVRSEWISDAQAASI
jgi:adenylylsulfate kinase